MYKILLRERQWKRRLGKIFNCGENYVTIYLKNLCILHVTSSGLDN